MSDGWGTASDAGRRIAPVHTLALTLEPGGWPEADAHRAEIDAHFAKRSAGNPHIFNGRILVSRGHAFADGRLTAFCRESDFAAFLWWRDHGWPDLNVANIFALAALEGSDGGFVLGVMGSHTATAGRIYFPGGTPDLSDVTADGSVDLFGSAVREMGEETGLALSDVAEDAGWTGVFDGPRVALLRRFVFRESADALAARIRAFLAQEETPELADVAVVRRESDITDQMAHFAVAYMHARWAARAAS